MGIELLVSLLAGSLSMIAGGLATTEVSQKAAEAFVQNAAAGEDFETRETETRKRIEDLQQIPLPAIEHLDELKKPGEKRSAKRDYMLFGAGVIVR